MVGTNNPESQALAIEVDLEAWEGIDETKSWAQLPVPHLQRARVWVQKKNGELLAENVERLIVALGWDGSAATIDRNPEIDQPVQWSSKGEPSTKDPSKLFFNAEYLVPYDYAPAPKERPKADSRVASSFDEKFGSQLRAIAGKVAQTNQASSPAPAPAPAPVHPPQNQDADPPPEYADLTTPPTNPPQFGGPALNEPPF
jgi:hypothetical protein